MILADSETHGDMGRVANALEFAKELKEARDEVQVIFDGAGTTWIRELNKDSHKMRPLYDAVRDKVAGACEYCAAAFGVKEAVQAAGVPLLGEFDRHPSLRKRMEEGYQVVTF